MLAASILVAGGFHAHAGNPDAGFRTVEAHGLHGQPCEDCDAEASADAECCMAAAACGLFLAHEGHSPSFRICDDEQAGRSMPSLSSISHLPDSPPPRPARS
jgi:hypothetical protein